MSLFVVKQLCQLLKAGMDIVPGRGTLLRIRLLSDQLQAEQGAEA